MDKEVIIKIHNLDKNYGKLQILKNINVNVRKYDVIAIIGPSGGGKSTFLRCINLLEIPTAGEILINGLNILESKNNINKMRQKVGMVFQHFNLFSNKNVLENLILAPIKTGLFKKQEAIYNAELMLKKVGLSDKRDAMPSQLSGGQKQRIAIARALCMKPDVVLFDEPTSSLDPEMVGDVLSIIRELAKEGLTMIIVTHEMGFAKNVANRIFFMDKGEIMLDEEPKKLFENPKLPRLKNFLDKVLNH